MCDGITIVARAPIVIEHSGVFRDLCENHRPVRLFQHYLTGRIILPHRRMANVARRTLDSADKINLSHMLSVAQAGGRGDLPPNPMNAPARRNPSPALPGVSYCS
jgi:hypothetical protein